MKGMKANGRRLLPVFILLLLCWLPLHGTSQRPATLPAQVEDPKNKLIAGLRSKAKDTSIVNPIARQLDADIRAIHRSFANDGNLPAADKEKAVRSMVYFINETGRFLLERKLVVYDIPGALASYRHVLESQLYKKPVEERLLRLSPARSQLLASAFSQYEVHKLLDDITVYKRMEASPEFILPFLEKNPRFRFADSLLLVAAAHDPHRLIHYLMQDKSGIRQRMVSSENIYLEQILALSDDKNATELLPFLVPLAENRITAGEILEKRMDVTSYFQLLVNTLLLEKDTKGPGALFLEPLRAGIREKSLSFYTNQVNELHDAADKKRFAPVNGLRAEDLYYILTSSGEELYTSSYLGLYKRLMHHFEKKPADSLFHIVGFDQFHAFMRLAANYNVLADFLGRMPQEGTRELVRRFIAGMERDPETGLERAMDIADSFGSLATTPETSDMYHEEMQTNLEQSTASKQYLGMRLYSILLQVFELVKDDGDLRRLWSTLGNYEILKREALRNGKGEIVQLVLFYGDEDGVASFSHFLNLYGDQKKWELNQTANWVSIRSLAGQPLVIYANRPLDTREELDLKAQDSLFAHLAKVGLEPGILVHRGHSYHLHKTLKRLSPSVKLAILGSCGGYNKAISIASANADVQVIGSKKMGAKSINDPIIALINETLINNEDLEWDTIWKKLETRFSKDAFMLSLFHEYFPPSNNLGLFVLKLFNYYNGFVMDGQVRYAGTTEAGIGH